jgi:protein involved in polysaccharide export with SLBB domain
VQKQIGYCAREDRRGKLATAMLRHHSPGSHLLIGLLVGSLVTWGWPRPAYSQTLPSRPADPAFEVPQITVEGMPSDAMGQRGLRRPELPAVALEAPIDPAAYTCGPGDLFELNFWGREELQLRVTVDLEGRVFIPRIGYFPASGKTLGEARAGLASLVARYYPGLNFDLTLVAPRQFTVHVTGNVERPGPFTVTPVERVSTVVGRANLTGTQRRIQIIHRDGTRGDADLLQYARTGELRYNPFLVEGDVVHVPHAGAVVTISGPVRRPGQYELKTGDLREALDLAEGFAARASRQLPIRVLRRDPRELTTALEVAMPAGGAAELPSFALLDDDVVVVPDTTELQHRVTVIGAVGGAGESSVRRLDYVAGETTRLLLERAGGVSPTGDLARSFIQRGGAVIPVDLDALLIRRDLAADRPLERGDVLVVPELRHRVLVDGAVMRGGSFPYNPVFGIDEYVALAGGATRNAKGVDAFRVVTADGRVSSYDPKLRLSPGDSIVVPERTYSRGEVVQIVMGTAGLILSGVAVGIAATR